MKGALNLLRNKKGEDPDTIKNELLKYRAEAIAILLKDYVQQILQSEDIPTQWNSSTLINTGKGRQDKEKLDNKRGTSLTSSIAKLFEKKYHQQNKYPSTIYRSASRSPTREKPTKQFVSFKICNTKEDDPRSRNTYCFYRLRKNL